MDLHDFKSSRMYFEENLPEHVNRLLDTAANDYEVGNAEISLLRASFLKPDSLTVLVGIYRFYYYQHRFEDALAAADRAMQVSAALLNIEEDWKDLSLKIMGGAIYKSMSLVRFYLLTLKGAAYMNMRLGNMEIATEMLHKILELDSRDRLGASLLLQSAMRSQIGLVYSEGNSKAIASA